MGICDASPVLSLILVYNDIIICCIKHLLFIVVPVILVHLTYAATMFLLCDATVLSPHVCLSLASGDLCVGVACVLNCLNASQFAVILQSDGLWQIFSSHMLHRSYCFLLFYAFRLFQFLVMCLVIFSKGMYLWGVYLLCFRIFLVIIVLTSFLWVVCFAHTAPPYHVFSVLVLCYFTLPVFVCLVSPELLGFSDLSGVYSLYQISIQITGSLFIFRNWTHWVQW